jgi:hypothetical protein
MSTLTIPKKVMFDQLAEVMEEYHPELTKAEVKVGLLAQWPGNNGDPLKLHGYPCAATVKITPYRLRVQGIADAIITLDGPSWEDRPHEEQVAILDHELYHLETVRDEDGELVADDAGRPKLKLRLHDWSLGGFAEISRRHKNAALEVQCFKNAHAEFYQAVFAWGDDMASDDYERESGGDSSPLTITKKPKLAANQ